MFNNTEKFHGHSWSAKEVMGHKSLKKYSNFMWLYALFLQAWSQICTLVTVANTQISNTLLVYSQ